MSSSEIDAAIDELAARHLVRRLPDGQVYRASPAEYRVPLEGVFGLTSHVDPMGGQLACKSRHTTMRRPPEDIARSLGLPPGEPVLAGILLRDRTSYGRRTRRALAASYLLERVAAALGVLLKPERQAKRTPCHGAQERANFLMPPRSCSVSVAVRQA